MRTTIALDDELLAKAESFTGLKEKTALIREALKALIERESGPAPGASRRHRAPIGANSSAPPPCQVAPRVAQVTVILVDTSIWVDHLRKSDAALAALLGQGRVLIHPFVIGELALGILRQRDNRNRGASEPSFGNTGDRGRSAAFH